MKPLFTMDFWNDGEYVDGCIAGGRRYLHINANGDMDSCACSGRCEGCATKRSV